MITFAERRQQLEQDKAHALQALGRAYGQLQLLDELEREQLEPPPAQNAETA